MDPCECVCNHIGAMRRLINMLTRMQEYCTDTDCLRDPLAPARANPPSDAIGSTLAMVLLAIVLAAVLYATRPASLRQRPQALRDPSVPEKPGPSMGSGPPPPGPSVG
eukprot:Opistho-1_new@90639